MPKVKPAFYIWGSMVNSVLNLAVRPKTYVRLPLIVRMLAVPALLVLLGTQLLAAGPYLKPGLPDGVALLAPPPGTGTSEHQADLATVRSTFKARDAAGEARATRHSTLSLFIFAEAIGPVFVPGKFPKTEKLFEEVKKDIGDPINVAKDHWKRKRPYEIDETLLFGKPERNSSYPSGHSARGTVYAMVLAEVFPDKREEILVVGREIGWDRVVIGKHFPTDIQAGRVLAQAIFRELKASPDFQRDVAEAREEARAVQQPREPVGQGH